MSYSEAMAKHYQDKASKSKIKVGDIVEFKNYEDMTDDEVMCISEEFFPKTGKITGIENSGFFIIERSSYIFNPKSVARVISDVDDIDISSLKSGDEVLVKVTVKKVFDGFIQINSSVGRTDVTKILKRKVPERFIVKENHYGMYIGTTLDLVSNKDMAQGYASRDAAYQEATDMHLNTYSVIAYDA